MQFDPKVPGPHAGEVSPRTLASRSPISLTDEQRSRAKFLRFGEGWDWCDIAADLGRSEADIQHSLANARSRQGEPHRRSLNVSVAAAESLRKLAHPGEPAWKTVNRILGI